MLYGQSVIKPIRSEKFKLPDKIRKSTPLNEPIVIGVKYNTLKQKCTLMCVSDLRNEWVYSFNEILYDNIVIDIIMEIIKLGAHLDAVMISRGQLTGRLARNLQSLNIKTNIY